MTFRKSKLIDNRPSWPALNFRGKCRNTMLLSPKLLFCRQSLNSLRKRWPAEEDNRFLLLWEKTVRRSKVHFPDLEVCCDWSTFFPAQSADLSGARTRDEPLRMFAGEARSLQPLLSLPRRSFHVSSRVISRVHFSRHPPNGELVRRLSQFKLFNPIEQLIKRSDLVTKG